MKTARSTYRKFRKTVFQPHKDYYEPSRIAAQHQAENEMFNYFVDAILKEIDTRNISLWSEAYMVVVNANQVWNKMIDYSYRQYKHSPVRRDMVLKLYKDNIPELRMVMSGNFRE